MKTRIILLFLASIALSITSCSSSSEASLENREVASSNPYNDDNLYEDGASYLDEDVRINIWLRIQGVAAWIEFRNDVVLFFESAANLSADWITDHYTMEMTSEFMIQTVAFQTADAKLADPALYQEIIEEIENVFEILNSDERTAILLEQFYEQANRSYETVIERLTDPNRSRIYFEQTPWVDYFAWENDEIYWQWGIIDGLEHMLELGSTERGVSYVMLLMYYTINEHSSACPIWIMTAVNDEIRDVIMEGVVDRIVVLQDGGFDIYMEYVEMLTDSRRVFDPRTQEVHDRVVQLIEERLMTD